MAAITPRRSTRIPHVHTPKMTERKKGLFQGETGPSDSLTKHRRLPVVESESDNDECDLGIISTLTDSSSCDENEQNVMKTPERWWRETRSQAKKHLREDSDLKNFMMSPYTLTKFQNTRHACSDTKCGSVSTPVTPHLHNQPRTPSSTHSCASFHTTSSSSSRVRKSLASLIADTESCSSSLKDLNFDTDSGADSKENTPSKSIRRSTRKLKTTPKMQNFKGILVEQKKNVTPMKTAVVCLTKMDMSSIVSPSQIQKTPNAPTTVDNMNTSPPKIRRSAIEVQESPESQCDSEKSHKRLHYDGMTEGGPVSKYPRLDPSQAPKARLSLFNSDRLKGILSAKSFYGKSNPDINTTVAIKISNAIEVTNTQIHRPFSHSHHNRRKRRPGQINLGVRHKIRKPKLNKAKIVHSRGNMNRSAPVINHSSASYSTMNDSSFVSLNTSQNMSQDLDKPDPFDKEKQTIEALLSQWTEDEVPESEQALLKTNQPELPCFNAAVIEETKEIFQPITAVPVSVTSVPHNSEAVIVDLETRKPAMEAVEPSSDDVVMLDDEGHHASHGDLSKSGQFLPVEGGYILVDGNEILIPAQEELPDLDEIERELKMLDEQIVKMAHSNNIDADAVLASTSTATRDETSTLVAEKEKPQKLFSIFNNPNPGINESSGKGAPTAVNKKFLKAPSDQYIIDAGQKKFGATQCNECGVIYHIGDPADEHDHLVHHNATDVLKFSGFKDECVVGKSDTGRCIRVRGGDAGWRRVTALLSRVVHPQLGYALELPMQDVRGYTAYLYIDKKQIVGCLVVEPKVKAYKLIPGDPDCCSVEEYPVKCGVSRIWTHKNYLRRGVASRLLDCARATFLYGSGVRTNEVAFSAPTAAGKAFASKYCGTDNFYVYLN